MTPPRDELAAKRAAIQDEIRAIRRQIRAVRRRTARLRTVVVFINGVIAGLVISVIAAWLLSAITPAAPRLDVRKPASVSWAT